MTSLTLPPPSPLAPPPPPPPLAQPLALAAPPPQHCPGTESEAAGASDACKGCPNQTICASGPKAPDPDIALVTERMSEIKHKILVLSGKGGVGKSSVTTNLAFALSLDESTQVGVLDVDICGPSIPKMFKLESEVIHQTSMGWSPVYVHDNLAVMSIGFLLPNKDDAVIWRGPKKNGMIKQFLKDVDWGTLDFLLVDTPPGTSDEHLSVVQYLKESGITGAIIVTTPQEVSLQDVRKEINFCRKVKIPILGIVENMSGFVCTSCNHTTDIFKPVTGGATAMCKDLGLDLLAQIPLDARIARSCDDGDSFLDVYETSVAGKIYLDMVKSLKLKLNNLPLKPL